MAALPITRAPERRTLAQRQTEMRLRMVRSRGKMSAPGKRTNRRPKALRLAHHKARLAAAERVKERFQWDRSMTIGLSDGHCTRCRGIGLHAGRWGLDPCGCVARAIFRACLSHWRRIQTRARRISNTFDGPGTWSRPREEYCADFELVSRRHLSDFEWRLFRLHFLAGLDYRVCAVKLGIDHGRFFHSVYRIERRLGRVFRELRPYPLFPVDEYYRREIGPVALSVDTRYSRGRRVWVARLPEARSGLRTL